VIQSNDEAKATTLPLGLFRYIVDADRSVMGGAVSNAGNLRQWGLREFRLNQDRRSERLLFARDLAARNPLVALPFWSAERAPTWPDARGGAIDGITYSSNAADLMRALACSVFYRLADILDLITTAGVRPGGIIISGGIVRSTPEVRLLADAIGRDVAVANEGEASLRGAAVYALQQSGAEIAPLRRGSLIRHDQKLTDEHMIRRRRQHALEKALTNDDL
jgi:gluconokinase